MVSVPERAGDAAGTAPDETRRVPTGAAAASSRRWWLVHQWVGLKLAVLSSFVLITGTLAVFGHELDWLLQPALRVAPSTVQGEPAWPALARELARRHPEARIQNLAAPEDRWFAATAVLVFEQPGGGERRRVAYLHPTTAEYRGDGHWVGAQRVLRQLHRHLMLPTDVGVPIVSSLAVLMAISLATSFVVYRKWWRGFLQPVRRTHPRTTWGDLHRLSGVWTLWFLLLMIVTSLWYLVESLGGQAPPLPSAKAPPAALTSAELAARLDANLAAARAAFPELRIRNVRFPTEDHGTFVFEGQHAAWLVRPRANAVVTEAATARVLRVADARELGVHQRISEMADPLHFGTFGGLATKAIWFVFGVGLSALAVSGVMIYGHRLLRRERRAPATAPALQHGWRGMGPWRWPATALVVASFVLLALWAPRA